ncbi:MAG: hypothetical protein RL652_666, partial [Pseudomonadota bacterium]
EQVRYVKKSNHIFSRIHVADIAQVLSKSLIYSKPGEIYNVADNLPCSYDQTISYACNLMGVKIPPSENFKSSNNSDLNNFYPITKNFIFGGKKNLILNKKIKCNFKIELLHGIRDSSVPWVYSINLTKTLVTKKLKITIIDDGDHSLSRVQDLKKLDLAIKNII